MPGKLSLISALLLVGTTAPVWAGPCSDEISRMEDRISTLLQAGARSGPSAAQGPAHRQPTPGSIAAAETKLGTVPSGTEEAIKALLAARVADGRGDQSACEQALSEVKRLIGP